MVTKAVLKKVKPSKREETEVKATAMRVINAAEEVISEFDKLLVKEEGEGILVWMVEGAMKLLSSFDEHGRVPMTEDQIGRVERLLGESDPVRTFCTTQLIEEEEDNVTLSEMFASFLRYCDHEGLDGCARKRFSQQVRSVMLEVYHKMPANSIPRYDKSERGYRGVKLVADMGDDEF